jgi:hypothetical protein
MSVTPTHVQIKQDIKALLLMTRVPRSLDVFFYFLWCWRKQQRLLPHQIRQDKKSIGSKLRKRSTDLLAPSTKVLQQKLGATTEVYQKYFDAFVIWKNKTSSSFQGRARTIEGWTPGAVKLFNKYIDIKIPDDIENRFYLITRTIDNQSPIGSKLSCGFYYRTKNSYRWYHPDQNITTAEKKKMFRDHFNIDIVSCFASLWWHELCGYKCEMENAQWLHPEHKDHFLSIIKRDFNVDNDVDAKDIRSKLFSSKRHEKEITKVDWFNNLREYIIKESLAWGKHNLPEGIKLTVHNVFTYLEWQVVERCLQAGKEALLMHDGVIFSELDVKRVTRLASPHKLKVEKW